VSFLAALLPKTFEQRQNWQERGKTGKREREFFAATRRGVELHSKALIAAKIGSDPRRAKKLSRHQNPNEKDINPALQPNSRFQGSKGNVIKQGSKVLQGSKIPQLQASSIARLQISRVPRFQSSRVPGFWDSKFPGLKIPSNKVPDLSKEV
jgi:hypothetical protein